MITEQTTDRPSAVEYEPNGEWTTLIIRTDITQHGAGDDAYFTAQLTSRVMRTEELTEATRARIEADPAAYLADADLGALKRAAEEKVQAWIDAKTKERTTCPCDRFPAGIVYDQQACLNALGLEAGDDFIDAENGKHKLTEADVVAIRRALKRHVSGLYALATMWRDDIAAATTEQALAAVMLAVD